MKKRFFAILLTALLAVNICSCNYVPEDELENKTSDTSDRCTNHTESLETNDSQTSSLGDESSNTTSAQDETVRDVPGVGQLKPCPSLNLTKASIWRLNEKEEYYIYLKEWDAYRHMPGLSSYHDWLYYTDNCVTVEDETATIALVDQNGKWDEPTIISYHFNRANDLVEFHAVPLNIKASSEHDTFFINMHNANHGYYFLTPNSFGHNDDRNGGALEWPLFMFETTDGGKNWEQIPTKTFGITKHIGFFKFASPQVGIISDRDEGAEDLYRRTYITVDGGLTWEPISKLPYTDGVNWYKDVIDLEYVEADDYYLLTVNSSAPADSDVDSNIQIQLWSRDLKNWTVVK